MLGGVATAVGAGIAAVMLDGESEGNCDNEAQEQETIEPQDDTEASEQSAS